MLTNEMLMFRVGSDEFVVLTGYRSVTDAEALAQKITALNGSSVMHNGKEIPLSMRISICKIPGGGLSYHEAFRKMHDTIDKVKQDDAFIGILDN